MAATEVRELELIALAARGRFTPAQVEAIRLDAFTGAPALFAWTCAAGACVRLGARSTFDAARHLRATCPRLDMPLDAWAELHRETADVIDAAERLDHEWAQQAARAKEK